VGKRKRQTSRTQYEDEPQGEVRDRFLHRDLISAECDEFHEDSESGREDEVTEDKADDGIDA
jgi:hypothetical protein